MEDGKLNCSEFSLALTEFENWHRFYVLLKINV